MNYYCTILAGALVLTLCACDSGTPPVSAMPAPRVTVVEIVPTQVTLTTEMAGRTVSYRKAEVRPEVRGLIREQCFKEGSNVEQGDLLYLIEPNSYQAAHDSAEAALSKAEASLAAAKLKDQRTAQLYKSNSVSQQDYDDTRTMSLQAQAEVAACKASLRSAKINLARTEIRAPISGRIGKSTVSVGTLITADQANALATIHQTHPMNVDLTQAADEVRAIHQQAGHSDKPGAEIDEMEADVRLLFSDGASYGETGKLRFADVGVDEGTGTVTIRAEFPNLNHELLPGIFVRAVVSGKPVDNALVISQRAVLRDNRGNPYVFVVAASEAGKKAERRFVTLGKAVGSNWLVLDGLQAGEMVILGGLHNVRPDAPVIVTGMAAPDSSDGTNEAANSASSPKSAGAAPSASVENGGA